MVPQCRLEDPKYNNLQSENHNKGEIYLEYLGKILDTQVTYKELYNNTENILAKYVEYFVHTLNMIDYQGLTDIRDLKNLHFSLKWLLNYVFTSSKGSWKDFIYNKELEINLPESL